MPLLLNNKYRDKNNVRAEFSFDIFCCVALNASFFHPTKHVYCIRGRISKIKVKRPQPLQNEKIKHIL